METVSLKVSLVQLMAGMAPLRSVSWKMPRIVVQANQPFTVLQELIRGLQHVVRYGTALRPDRVLVPFPHDTGYPEAGGFHLAVHRRLAGLIGVAVLVVKGTGTAMLNQVPSAVRLE